MTDLWVLIGPFFEPPFDSLFGALVFEMLGPVALLTDRKTPGQHILCATQRLVQYRIASTCLSTIMGPGLSTLPFVCLATYSASKFRVPR